MKLVVIRAAGARTPPGIVPVLEGLARRLSPRWMRVQLVLADDRILRRLNREYRGIDRPTDVLSFLYDKSQPGEIAEAHAEIYVSLARAKRQARERKHGLSREVVLLVLHGLLHLQGHEHERPSQARKMRAAELPQLRWLARRWGCPAIAPLVQVPQDAPTAVR